MCDFGEELGIDGEAVVERVAGASGETEGKFALKGKKENTHIISIYDWRENFISSKLGWQGLWHTWNMRTQHRGGFSILSSLKTNGLEIWYGVLLMHTS